MLKIMTLLKRRPGMSIEEFVAYYEDVHAKLGGSYLKRHAVLYRRNYLRAMANPLTGEVIEPPHDVLTEVWFPDHAAWEASMEIFTDPAIAAEMVADEERLFDRAKTQMCIVENVQDNDFSQ